MSHVPLAFSPYQNLSIGQPFNWSKEMMYLNELTASISFIAIPFIAYAGFTYLFPMNAKKLKKHLNLFRMSIIFVFSGFLFGLLSTGTIEAESKVSALFMVFLIFYPMFLFANGKRTSKNVNTQKEFI